MAEISTSDFIPTLKMVVHALVEGNYDFLDEMGNCSGKGLRREVDDYPALLVDPPEFEIFRAIIDSSTDSLSLKEYFLESHISRNSLGIAKAINQETLQLIPVPNNLRLERISEH